MSVASKSGTSCRSRLQLPMVLRFRGRNYRSTIEAAEAHDVTPREVVLELLHDPKRRSSSEAPSPRVAGAEPVTALGQVIGTPNEAAATLRVGLKTLLNAIDAGQEAVDELARAAMQRRISENRACASALMKRAAPG